MEETTTPPPPSRKKIRLTRAEAYAMRLSSPRKKKLEFLFVGLAIAAALGYGLWHFQDEWLPYWLPSEEQAAAPATGPVAGEQPATAPAEPQTAAFAAAPLDFLSAAIWDHPRFLQGVRLFNQALDRHHAFRDDRNRSDLPPQIEAGARQAAAAFEEVRAEAPPAVPLADYLARCRRLVAETRRLARPEPVATPPPPPEAPPYRPGEPWQHPDYLAGANLFNQALEQYKVFLADKKRTELLQPIEEGAFQAAKTFEALRGQAPEGVPLADHITQCYKLISDCRRQHLEGAPAAPANPFDRGTTGPSRRPALPAYQPPP